MKNVLIEVTGTKGSAKITYTWTERGWVDTERESVMFRQDVTASELRELKRCAEQADGDTELFEEMAKI